MTIDAALRAISTRQRAKNRALDYYEGRHPLVYSNARLHQVFHRLDGKFQLNWCSVVVDSVLERVNLRSLEPIGSEPARELMAKLWKECCLSLESDDVHRAALVMGEAFAFVWRDSPADPIDCYFHDPRQCCAFYDPQRPHVLRGAAKWWVNDSGRNAVSLYFDDRVEHYIGPQASSEVPGAHEFELEAIYPHPWGRVPVFHFRRERSCTGELECLYEVQDAVNKLFNDMMVCSEFGVFAQRYIVSNADVAPLRSSPNQIWHIPAGSEGDERTQVGQFDPLPLTSFLEPMAELVGAMSAISRTPRHYFLRRAGDPSGEALIAMEAPLVHKASRIIERLIPVWESLGRFLLQLSGMDDVPGVVAVFDPPVTLLPKALAEIRELSVRAGIPLATHLRFAEGWPQERLQQLERDQEASA